MTEDQFGLTGTDNNNEETIQIDDFEVVISDVLNEVITIFNIKTSAISSIPIGYRIFQDYKCIPNHSFSDETIKWLEEKKNPETVFIVGYKRDEYDVYEIVSMTLQDLSDALDGAIRDGSFMAQHLYAILEEIKLKIFDKYEGGIWIPVSSRLLDMSNSIIYKDDIPVLVVESCESETFYNITKREFAPENIELIFNFDSPHVISSYENPKNKFLTEDYGGDKYKIVFKCPTMNKLILATALRTEHNVFSIVGLNTVDDYKNAKKILEDNFDDLNAILNALVDNRLSADTEELLDLVD